MATVKKEPVAQIIDYKRVNRVHAVVTVEGDSMLVTNQFSAKAKQIMLDAMQGKKPLRSMKPHKDPEADYEGSKYLNDKGECCVRSISFKCAMLDASIEIPGVTAPHIRRTLQTLGELLPIRGCEPVMREDAVVVVSAMGKISHDLRYRAQFWPWSVAVPIAFDGDALRLEDVGALMDRAGFGTGIGEYRVQRKGNWGMFHVTTIDVLRGDAR